MKKKAKYISYLIILPTFASDLNFHGQTYVRI